MNVAAVLLKLLDIVALGARLAPDILVEYRSLSEAVKKMLDEGRDPTPAEWADLDARTAKLLEEISGA